jgi:hypothetical protein
MRLFISWVMMISVSVNIDRCRVPMRNIYIYMYIYVLNVYMVQVILLDFQRVIWRRA